MATFQMLRFALSFSLIFFAFSVAANAYSPFPITKTSFVLVPADDGPPILFDQARPLDNYIVDNSTIEMSSPSEKSNFRTVTQFTTDYSPSKITKYESKRTGMTAVVVDREGPKVHGFFAFATEIFDDSGAPHTLEHLCFMGSKSYPYKGILDKLATRCVVL